MVDFNSEGMLGTNRSHILDLVVLQRRDEFINTYEEFIFSKLNNSSDKNIKLNRLKSRLLSLSMELDKVLTRKIKFDNQKITYEQFKKDLNTKNDEDSVLKQFDLINDILDSLNITRIDTKRQIDYTDLEAVNQSKGL